MITLLTGAPGSGKTAQLVEWLRTTYKDRPLFVAERDGRPSVKGLTLPHTLIDPTRWHLDLPDGAIMVCDEVQKWWRPRGPGHAPTDAVKEMEEHRHRDVDFFFTTQKPSLVDANIRGLVGRHVHFRDTGWLGRWMYEWPEVSENIAWKTCNLKRRYKVPKTAFPFYISASGHTGVEKGKSWMPVIAALLCLTVAVLVFMVYRAVASHTAPKPVQAAQSAQATPEPARAARSDSAASAAARWPVYDAVPLALDREPYAGRALQLEGGYKVGTQLVAFFGIVIDGHRVATVSLKDLTAMGYSYTELGPCSGSLRFRRLERLVTCQRAVEPEQRARPSIAPQSPPDALASPAGAV